jgi:hypothetical protein
MWRNEGWLVSSADTSATERPAIPWIRTYLQGSATIVPVGTPTTAPTAVVTTAPGNLGDCNNDGSINIVDALLIAQFYVGLNPANFIQGNADANRDGSANIVDALLIAQCYVGLRSCTF